RKDERVLVVRLLAVGAILQAPELAAPPRELLLEQVGRAGMIQRRARPVYAALAVDALVGNAPEGGRHTAPLLPDVGGVRVVPAGGRLEAQPRLKALGEVAQDLPVGARLARRGDGPT